MSQTDDYLASAESDAKSTIQEYADAILEQLLDDDKASDDLLNDYPDGDAYHHESHVDKWYSLIDAATLIDQLSKFEETDSGLWEGQQPKEAIGTCAAYTYGNAVYSEWTDLIRRINSEAEDIISDFAEEESDLEKEISDLEDAEGEDAEGEAEQKQADLDGLTERKENALREIINSFSN